MLRTNQKKKADGATPKKELRWEANPVIDTYAISIFGEVIVVHSAQTRSIIAFLQLQQLRFPCFFFFPFQFTRNELWHSQL